MTDSSIPNIRVWSFGKQYVEAAEVLLDTNRVLPATVLSALALEVLLKSFLATSDDRGRSKTERGHNLPTLFGLLPSKDQDDILISFREIDSTTVLPDALLKYNDVFAKARYFYEPTSPLSVSSEIIYFARDFCAAVFEVAKSRNL